MAILVDITSDFICPWCWIGHQNLKTALALSGLQNSAQLRYLPFELNRDMPAQGMNRKAYRSAKFGNWARSQSMDEDVTQAGKLVGLDFHYDRIEITPNTQLAHRLMAYTQLGGDHATSGRMFEAIFTAYFSQGRHIGDPAVLLEIATTHGLDAQQAAAFMSSKSGAELVTAAVRSAHAEGINSVPSIVIGAHRIAGAQSAESLAAILLKLQKTIVSQE